MKGELSECNFYLVGHNESKQTILNGIYSDFNRQMSVKRVLYKINISRCSNYSFGFIKYGWRRYTPSRSKFHRESRILAMKIQNFASVSILRGSAKWCNQFHFIVLHMEM